MYFSRILRSLNSHSMYINCEDLDMFYNGAPSLLRYINQLGLSATHSLSREAEFLNKLPWFYQLPLDLTKNDRDALVPALMPIPAKSVHPPTDINFSQVYHENQANCQPATKAPNVRFR